MIGLLDRMFGRDPGAAAEIPEPTELVHWQKMPAVLAAETAYAEADAAFFARREELRQAAAKREALESSIAETGVGSRDELAELEARDAALFRELKWANFRADRAQRDLDAAAEMAKAEMARTAHRLLAAAQRRVYQAALRLWLINGDLADLIGEVEKAGINLGVRINQTWPVIDGEMLDRFKHNARWMQAAPVASPDLRYFAEVVVRRLGPEPIRGVSPGERCWIPKTDINRLLKARAIEVVGTPEGIFVPPPQPAADVSGDVTVRFVDDYLTQIGGGAWRMWHTGETAKVNQKIAWEAVCDQKAEWAVGAAAE